MRDEYEMRLWNEHRAALVNCVGFLFGKIMHAFRVLHRIEWSAPWHKERC